MEEKIIITTDWHLNETCIDELYKIIDEVYFGQNFKPTETVIIGDLFDRKRPTPREIDAMTDILCKLLKHMPVTVITGNHEELSGTYSALDYTKHFGVQLFRNKHVMSFLDENKKVLFGHFFTEETDQYARSNITIAELEAQANLVLLGHFHGFKKMGNYVYHLGSLRRCNFKEVEFGIPKYAIMHPRTLEIEFKDVKSAIPMYEVDSCREALKKPNMSKVRVVIRGFDQFKKEANLIPECQKKFFEFKVKLDFKNIVERTETVEDRRIKSFDEIFEDFLISEIKDEEVVAIIKECRE